MRYSPLCEQLSRDVKRRFICCAGGSRYRAAVISTEDPLGPQAGMHDPLDGVVLPVRPDDASRYGWRTRPAALHAPHRLWRIVPVLGAS